MNRNLANRRRLIALIILVLAVPLTIFMVRTVQEIRQRAAGGANASLSMPASLSVQLNQTVNVPITLNTDGAGVRGVDVILNFDRTRLQVVSITPNAQAGTTLKTYAPVTSTGAFDTTRVVNDANANGRAEFGAVTYDWGAQAATAAYSGTTTLATVQFRGIVAGTTPVTFQFTPGSTTDTNIVLDSNPPQDLLTAASQLTNTSITVSSGTSPSPTPTTGGPTPTPGQTGTVTLQVSSSSDDVNQAATTLDLTNPVLRIGNCGASSCHAGLRFNNVSIPKGASITSATLQFYSTQSQWQDYGFTYKAEGVGNSSTFSTGNTPAQRTLLAPTVTHASNVSWSAGTWYTMDNIASVIQAVVNQTTWASGNSLSLILTGTVPTGFGSKFVASYDQNPTLAPKLVITYAGGTSASPTPTATVPTATPTRTPTPTTGAPTATPTRTPTPQPNSTAFTFTLKLHGIGTGGDSVNPNGTGNTNPLTPQRPVTVQVLDGSNAVVLSQNGTVNYNTSTGVFTGSVNMGTTLASGPYLVRIKSPKYLQRGVDGIKTITAGQTHDMGTLDLIVGDVNNDNTLNILDYNLISDCYSDLAPPRACSDPAKKASTDITDDGNVNQFDYNLFIRELSVRSGE